jgi:hypothetical protein
MNAKSKLILSLGLLALPLALWAKSSGSAYVDSYHGRTDIPVPISVVMPEVSAQYAGRQVTLVFVVDAKGQPGQIAASLPGTQVSCLPEFDAALVAAVTTAIKQWRFAPALVNGLPVAKKVALPLLIVDSLDANSRLAMN